MALGLAEGTAAGKSRAPTTNKMKLNLKSATVGLMGFVCGLLVMYVSLLSAVHPLANVSQFVDRFNKSRIEAMLVRAIEGKLLINVTNPDEIPCNRSLLGSGCLYPGSAVQSPRIGYVTQDVTWDDIQGRRRQQIDETCRKLHQVQLEPPELRSLLADNANMYIDDKHRILFCTVPKVACSSWKSALAVMTNRLPKGKLYLTNVHSKGFMNDIGLASPGDLNATHLQRVLDNYTKIFVVRHPFERLLSAYRDKFVTRNKWTKYFQSRYGRKIVLLYRGDNVSTRSLRKGHDVTFEEFLRFLVDDSVPEEERLNPHWNTYQSLCHPCQVRYDHVIKMETMDADNAVILSRYFSVDNSTEFFPKRNMKLVPSGDLVAKYYADIPAALIDKVFNFVRVDMDMFGYHLPEVITTRLSSQ